MTNSASTPPPEEVELYDLLKEFYEDMWHLEYSDHYAHMDRAKLSHNRIEEAETALLSWREAYADKKVQDALKGKFYKVLDIQEEVHVPQRIVDAIADKARIDAKIDLLNTELGLAWPGSPIVDTKKIINEGTQFQGRLALELERLLALRKQQEDK